MITRHDLDEAIAECQGQRNPNANTCLKLAAFYTIRKEMFGESAEQQQPMYSYAPEPAPAVAVQDSLLGRYGDSEFLTEVEGRRAEDIMPIMDELMESMEVLQPRIYESVLRKIRRL